MIGNVRSNHIVRSERFAVLAALLGTRLPVLVLGAVAVTIVGTLPPPTGPALWRVSPSELQNLLARWDSAWYYSIATDGYHWDPLVFRHQNVVFFPLYPVLMRLGGLFLGGPLAAGLVVSLAAFGGAMALLYRLAVLELGERYAGPAVLLVSTYPFAIFYSAVYTESLFLFLSVGTFYAMRRNHLLLAALAGVAAGLTRPNGCWLALPLLWIAANAPKTPAASTSQRLSAFVVALAPIAGTAIYSTYLLFRFGDALAWVHGQAAWGLPLAGRSPAPEAVLFPADEGVSTTDVITWTANIATFVLAAAAIKPVFRRLGPAYAIWIAVNIFPPVFTHLFLSLGRFTSVLFPLFLWLATVIPQARLSRVATGFAAVQALFAVLFFLWRPVV